MTMVRTHQLGLFVVAIHSVFDPFFFIIDKKITGNADAWKWMIRQVEWSGKWKVVGIVGFSQNLDTASYNIVSHASG